MYDNNDFYGNGGYDRDQNDYKGYSPYEPPSGGKKKKGGKGWLYALLIVLAVVVVATYLSDVIGLKRHLRSRYRLSRKGYAGLERAGG